MPIRFPFRRAAGGPEVHEEQHSGADRGFQQTAVSGAKPLDIKEPTEYKLSEINDCGVYLPPSPPEKPSFWHSRSNLSTTSSNHRSMLSENEPFNNISRESFDSYRRSFDISARSPIPDMDTSRKSFDMRRSLDTRQSLDSRRSLDTRRSRALPRSSFQERRIDRPDEATVEEGFEDVGLNDEAKPAPKKRGIFSRFGDNNNSEKTNDDRPASSHGFHFTGRKRGQSGQGSELRDMSKSRTNTASGVPVEAR